MNINFRLFVPNFHEYELNLKEIIKSSGKML